jgi:hypothetical protein
MIKNFGILNSLIALIGLGACVYLAYQVWYGVNATHATATVQSYERRMRGQGSAVLAYEIDGNKVEAKTRVWLRELAPGEEVTILYRPDKPEFVFLDDFRQRYVPSIAVILFAGTVVAWGVFAGRKGRRGGQVAPVRGGA